MSLIVISTPIGNYDDITLRAIESLKKCEVVICEELKPAKILFKRLEIEEREFFQLNEHSKSQELRELIDLCKTKEVALISDCGTPGFCDPGADLVNACLTENIKVDVNPGPSSLMTLLSLTGEKLKRFYFVGFLPAEKNDRATDIQKLKNFSDPLVFMDTPYRLKSTLQDLIDQDFGSRKAVLGVDLTGPAHKLMKGTVKSIAGHEWQKLPFVLMVWPGR